ncbi:MAG: hypothetical protein J6M19_03935 [Bacteroidaceae bacterium]|nr:hypothetical protein [Bacteroidaceae bacterium]
MRPQAGGGASGANGTPADGCSPCPSLDRATDSSSTHPPSESVTPSEFRSGCSTSAGVPSFQDSTTCL